jgi:hypothetical protein
MASAQRFQLLFFPMCVVLSILVSAGGKAATEPASSVLPALMGQLRDEAPRQWKAQRAGVQPFTHRPAPLNCIVTPLSGK